MRSSSLPVACSEAPSVKETSELMTSFKSGWSTTHPARRLSAMHSLSGVALLVIIDIVGQRDVRQVLGQDPLDSTVALRLWTWHSQTPRHGAPVGPSLTRRLTVKVGLTEIGDAHALSTRLSA